MIRHLLLFGLAAVAVTEAPAAPQIVQAPQTWEYLGIAHMAENFGFSLPVLLMVVAGALVGAWNSYHDKRSNLAITFLSSTVLALSAVVLVPEFTGYQWSGTGIQSTAGMLLAFTAQNWGPELIRAVGPGVKSYLRRFLPTQKGNDP